MPTREEVDIKERADRALRTGKPQDALALYRALIAKMAVFEPGLYESWLEGAFAAYRTLGRKQEAAYVSMALERYAEAERLLDRRRRPVEWALCLARQGRKEEAARHLLAFGFPVLAAGELQTVGDLAGARAIWEKLLQTPRLRNHPYERALIHLVLSRLDRQAGDAQSARLHGVAALQTFEALADDFEARGLRERAFDCYTLILRLGREEGSFENIAEGYGNAIRVLAADHQRYLPLQYCDDFIAEASERHEWQTAALIALDAADHSRRMGLAYEKHYLERAVALWMRAAQRSRESTLAPDVAESALSAALDAAVSMGDLPLLGKIYGLMADLPLAPERKERYARLAARYARAGENPAADSVWPALPLLPVLPNHLRIANPYPDIGWQDLVEWELDGDPIGTLALVVDRADHVRFKRQALRALLIAAAPPQSDVGLETDRGAGAGDDVAAATELALALGNVQIYEVLRPLERLYEQPAPAVRAAVMAGAGQVLNKRSFGLIRQGLADGDVRVREDARRALRGLRFRDGLDPLTRIFNDFHDPAIKETALAAIADIGSLEAGLFLLDVVRDCPDPLRTLAINRLRNFAAAELVPHVRAAMELSIGPAQQTLRAVLRSLETGVV